MATTTTTNATTTPVCPPALLKRMQDTIEDRRVELDQTYLGFFYCLGRRVDENGEEHGVVAPIIYGVDKDNTEFHVSQARNLNTEIDKATNDGRLDVGDLVRFFLTNTGEYWTNEKDEKVSLKKCYRIFNITKNDWIVNIQH